MSLKNFIFPCHVASEVLQLDSSGNASWEKRCHDGVYVLFVTGESVGSRYYDESDPICRRIETNSDLYVSVHDAGIMDYVRKSVVDSAMRDSCIGMIGVVVCRELNSADIEDEVKAIRDKRLSWSALKKDIPLADFLSSKLLKQILLPVLLLYLAVLLANFIVHSKLTKRLSEIRSTYAIESVEAKKRSAITQAQKHLLSEYEAVPDIGMSALFDAVACSVPGDVRLTSLSINAPLMKICGEALFSETAMSFVDSLRNVMKSETVNVVMLEKDKKEGLFRFEIHVKL